MLSWTEEEALSVFGTVVQRAGVLDVGDTFDCHTAFAKHGEIRLA